MTAAADGLFLLPVSILTRVGSSADLQCTSLLNLSKIDVCVAELIWFHKFSHFVLRRERNKVLRELSGSNFELQQIWKGALFAFV